ncbi:MAG: hypothetical protein JXR81_03150 [Candidatus Goldbacteria bacterium]|nr:hypothetical protein [Candidatus Goldiibacteriota bacterium]
MKRVLNITVITLVMMILSAGCADKLNFIAPKVNENAVIVPTPAVIVSFDSGSVAVSSLSESMHAVCEMNGNVYSAGGWDGVVRSSSVFSSADGVNFTRIADNSGFTPRTGHSMIPFNNALWITGGYDGSFKNDVWYSADGISWFEASGSAAFSPRQGMTLQNFKGNMWLIGGTNAGGEAGDIYWSLNGAAWVKASNAPEGTGIGHTSFVFHGKMYIVAVVQKNTKYDNPLWVSEDGIKWVQADKDLNFGFQHIAGAVVMNNKIYVLGDVCANYPDAIAQKGDVYESEDGLKWKKMKIDNAGIKCGFHPVAFGDKLVLVGGY